MPQQQLVEKYNAMRAQMDESGEFNKDSRVSVREALSTPDASVLMPRVVQDVLRDAAEPMYIGSKLLQVVRITEGRSIEFPAISAMRAHDIAEGQEYPEETVDFNKYKTTEIRVGKSGMKVRITDEMISDSQWDVIGIMLRKAGQAMARHKEEKIFKNFSEHGWTVFDNDLADPNAHTTGKGFDGATNGTLSTENFIDLMIGLMSHNYYPTDVLMHPLVWSLFAKNEYIDVLSNAAFAGGTGTVSLQPTAVQGRIPFAINIQLSPFIPFDKKTKKFDMYVVDANEIGVLLVKEDLSVEQFDEPLRDIQTIKIKERYGIGILNEGRAITVAKNIAFDKTYPDPTRVKQI